MLDWGMLLTLVALMGCGTVLFCVGYWLGRKDEQQHSKQGEQTPKEER